MGETVSLMGNDVYARPETSRNREFAIQKKPLVSITLGFPYARPCGHATARLPAGDGHSPASLPCSRMDALWEYRNLVKTTMQVDAI